MNDMLSEDWLRNTGFQWEQLERQPSKHWVLWLAPACIDPGPDRRLFASSRDLGIEIAASEPYQSWWYCWLRADYAGRYSRFLHIRHVTKIEEVIKIIEALTGREWNADNVMYGSLHDPETAARIRAESERLDRRIAASWGEQVDDDPSKRGIVHVG